MEDVTACCPGDHSVVYNGDSMLFNVTSGVRMLQPVDVTYSRMRFVINDILLPIIFGAGVAGNALNAILLSLRRGSSGDANGGLGASSGGRPTSFERSAAAGLVALSASDLAFCLVGFVRVVFLGTPPSGSWRAVAGLYYSIYRGALLNLFLFSSTWLIALVSVERCLAVCYPFRAGEIIRVRRTVAAHVVVCAVSGLLNVPLFLRSTVVSITSCRGGLPPVRASDRLNSTVAGITLADTDETCAVFYYARPSTLSVSRPGLLYVHKVVWFALGTFLPLLLIVYSNARLIREICRMRSAATASSVCLPSSSARFSSKTSFSLDRDRSSTVTLTLTLIAIGVCFLVLVCPSMAIQFWRFASYSSYGGDESPPSWSGGRVEAVAILVTNLTQAIKFSSNFLLYCVVNRSFRRTFSRLFRVRRCSGQTDRGNVDDEQHNMAGRVCNEALIEPAAVDNHVDISCL